MQKLTRIGALLALLALLTLLCGFHPLEFWGGFEAHRGEPVTDAIARLGSPVATGYTGGQRIYYWRVDNFEGRRFCKIWGAARHNIIVNWGYQECAFWAW